MSDLPNTLPTSEMNKELPIDPYFIFLAQFRENLKLRNLTNINVGTAAQMACQKWRQMKNTQKAVYEEIANRNRDINIYLTVYKSLMGDKLKY